MSNSNGRWLDRHTKYEEFKESDGLALRGRQAKYREDKREVKLFIARLFGVSAYSPRREQDLEVACGWKPKQPRLAQGD